MTRDFIHVPLAYWKKSAPGEAVASRPARSNPQAPMRAGAARLEDGSAAAAAPAVRPKLANAASAAPRKRCFMIGS